MALKKGNNIQVELVSMKKPEIVVDIELPLTEKELRETLYVLTGTQFGIEYRIEDSACPYFEINKNEDIWVLNKVADIINQLYDREKLLLKNWCNRWQNEYTDLGEIGNAALQIRNIDYVEGITTYKELGQMLCERAGGAELLEQLHSKRYFCILPGVERYLNYEAIGSDYDQAGNVNYAVWENEQICGYVLDDSMIDIDRFTKNELLETETEALFQQCDDEQVCIEILGKHRENKSKVKEEYER